MFLFLVMSAALWGQSGRNYHYFTLDLAGKIDFIINQNTYGRPELKYSLKPGYGYGIGYGYDIGNRHKIQTGIRYLTGGQYYTDVFGGIKHSRDIELFYLQLPLIYKFIWNRPSKTYRKDFQWISSVGLNFSYLTKALASYKIDDKTVSFIDFVNYHNDRIKEVRENPDASDPTRLYRRWDFAFYGSMSALYFVLDYVAIELELNGTIGFVDMNRLEWQIKNPNGQYSPSYNSQLGSRLTLLYYIPFW